MKRTLQITVLLLLALNIAVPAFQSCTKETPKTDNTALQVKLENLVSDYNVGVMLGHEKAILTEGEMTVMTLPSKEVLFFLKKTGESTNDIFLCQGTELSSTIQKKLGKVKVAYLREALAVETQNGEIYTFTIGERKGHEIVQKVASSWSGKGYGLAHSHGRSSSPSDYKGISSTDEIKTRDSDCKCRPAQNQKDDSNCNSGGVGSSRCSIGATVTLGCAVSCSGSSYACCINN